MFDNAVRLLTPDYKNLNWKTVLLILFLVAFFIRFPFFFRDYIDRDESTFIIMGQSWVDGFLPYTKLWDLKPPVTFLFFAGVIAIFGKSFLAIRFFGTLLVVCTAFFTYKIGLNIISKKVGFWCSLFCVFLFSLFGSLQGVMSEHICTLFFVAGFFILVRQQNAWRYLLAGILFGLSVMSKLNMAYPLLTLCLFLLWTGIQKKNFFPAISKLITMGLGVFLIIFLTALPYFLADQQELWWRSIFEAPLAYSKVKFHSPLKALPVALVFAAFFLGAYKFKWIDFRNHAIQMMLAVVIGVLVSFIQAGKVNGHYLIQLYPFVLIPIGMAIGKLHPIQHKYRPIIILLLVLIPIEAYLEYGNIISNKIKKGSFYNGEGIEVPRYIMENDLETKNIFLTEYHIGYWVMNVSPPTKAATHPSNITREVLFPYMDNPRSTSMQELQYILEEIQPKTIVARKGKRIFDKKLVELNAYIDGYLEEHYTLAHTIDRGLIYQRLE
ncbi:ArnT family glycosyltransferase [Flagellimonas allohymeniacidonis]|uniref:Glycosyltransferase n=1 Tax=Flagellimonas allohymeniacidonis TaxID=2517819 RepID=A0A4Q8QI48_9FLAO|nr:glycosyltransferase family 39 protein [Allomuricauda hymeniacidonis]TAI47866.1 glycosyltransferase [Allomuricauda hymeniacidonis]